MATILASKLVVVVLAVAAAVAPGVNGATVQTTTVMTLSTSPNTAGSATTPAVVGINAGHRAQNDTTWMAFMQALGVNGIRLFGGSGQVSVSMPGASANGGALQSAAAFAGCNPDLSNICSDTRPGCKTCNPLGSGLIDYVNYAQRKVGSSNPNPVTPLCMALGNCSLSMSNPPTQYTTYASYTQPSWGQNMNGTLVTTMAQYTAAVATLRAWTGHNPANAGAWVYPPPYAMIDWWGNQQDQTGYAWQVTASTAYVINASYAALGIRPLLVSHLGCGSFSLSTLDPTNSTYWAEHWEVYKFTYAAAQWMYKYNITKVELHNEPDLSGNNACMNPAEAKVQAATAAFNAATGASLTVYQFADMYWADYISVRSVATQDAYADANADVAAGRMACPLAGACPVTINVYGSAYALSLGNPQTYATTAIQFGGAMVQNAYFRFPCTATTCTPNTANWNGTTATSKSSPNFPWGVDTTFSTFQVYSYHSYGQTGDNLWGKGIGYTNSSVGYANVLGSSASASFAWKGPNGGTSSNQFMPIAVTEYAPLTGADYNVEGSSSDSYYQASRLATELLAFVRLGQESYYFKFSMMPSGSATGNPSAATVVNKHGIHFGENTNVNSMQVGDQTSGGAAFALIAPYVTGAKPLLQCSLSDTTANFTWPPTTTSTSFGVACALIQDGSVYRIFLVNDCSGTPGRAKAGVAGDTNYCSDRQINIPLSSLNVNPGSVMSVSEVSAPAGYCTNPVSPKDGTSGGTRPCNDPAFTKYATLFPANAAAVNAKAAFSNTPSNAGYFGEVSNFVTLTAANIASGVPYTIPAFGVARIDIPMNAQSSSSINVVTDTTLLAGANSDTNLGSAYNLSAAISASAIHDTTSTILMQFNTPTFAAANLATLTLTVASAPNVGNVILQVLGINPTLPPVWSEGVATWNTMQYLLGQPAGVVQSIGDNFVTLGPTNRTNPSAGTYNYLIGHISVSANDATGTQKTIDITKFVQMAQKANACSINIAVVRRFRQNLQSPADQGTGCSASTIAAGTNPSCPAGISIGSTLPSDSLAGGATVFYSTNFPGMQTGPTVNVYSDSTAASQSCNAKKQLNTTVSSTMYVQGVTSKTNYTTGRRHLLQAPAAPLQQALAATAAAVATTLNIPSNGVYVSIANFSTQISIAFSQVPTVANGLGVPPYTGAQVSAAFNFLGSQGTYNGSVVSNNGVSTDVVTPISTEYFIVNNVSYSPASVAALNAQQASAGNAFPANLSAFRASLPAGVMEVPANRRKLLQNGYFGVTMTFASLAQCEAFIAYMTTGSGTADLNTYMNAQFNATNGLTVSSNVVFPPIVSAGVLIDVFAPYHSPASSDIVFYSLQNSASLNTALDSLPAAAIPGLSGRRRGLLQAANPVGDIVDIVVSPSPPVITTGWNPTGSAAPATQPELIIIVSAPMSSATAATPTKFYTRKQVLGLGLGLGIGEAAFFSVVIVGLAVSMKSKPAAAAASSSEAKA